LPCPESIIHGTRLSTLKPEVNLGEAHRGLSFGSKAGLFRETAPIRAYLRERRIARLLEAAGTSEEFMTREDLEEFRKDD
jgi:hypothetical protein